MRNFDSRLKRLESRLPEVDRWPEIIDPPCGVPDATITGQELSEWAARVALGARYTDDVALELSHFYFTAAEAATRTPGWKTEWGNDPALMAAGEQALRDGVDQAIEWATHQKRYGLGQSRRPLKG